MSRAVRLFSSTASLVLYVRIRVGPMAPTHFRELRMELKEFLAQTLAEIAEGVATGAEAASKFGAIVNPGGVGLGGVEFSPEKVSIEFTIGLTVTDGTKTKGGIGVVAGIFALGSQGESTGTTGSTTHIKFTIPAILPNPVKRKKS